MDRKIINLDDNETEKYKFHQYERPNWIDNIDVNEVVEYSKISFGKINSKYYIGYKDAKKIDLSDFSFQK